MPSSSFWAVVLLRPCHVTSVSLQQCSLDSGPREWAVVVVASGKATAELQKPWGEAANSPTADART